MSVKKLVLPDNCKGKNAVKYLEVLNRTFTMFTMSLTFHFNLFYITTECPKKNAHKIFVWKNSRSLNHMHQINMDPSEIHFISSHFTDPNWFDQ